MREDLSCDVQSNSCGVEGSASEVYPGLARLEETGSAMALSDGWSLSASAREVTAVHSLLLRGAPGAQAGSQGTKGECLHCVLMHGQLKH